MTTHTFDITAAVIPPQARSVLVIDLDALRANWALLAARTARTVECAAVVKAEAYGLGVEAVIGALSREGCRTFFTATLREAQRIRQTASKATVYVLDGLLPGAAKSYADAELRPVLSSWPEIEEWSTFCQDIHQRLPAAIHVDTGMNRLGLSFDELRERSNLPQTLAHFELALVMSHLACADTPSHPLNARQKTLFDEARGLLPEAPASLANSGGILLGPEFHYDVVRPGIALYGGNPLEGRPNPMQPVIRLLARVLQVRDVKPGETIGYGAAHAFAAPARTATIAYGYADGYPRAMSVRAMRTGIDDTSPVATVGGTTVPLVGRISMDLVTLDVSSIPIDLIQRGSWVELAGRGITVDDLAARAGTIGYEILTNIGRRSHRIYLENGKAL
jgi:alanine racemase